MDRTEHRGREAGGVPLDLVLVLVVIVAVVAAGAWYTAQTGGLVWLVFAVTCAVVLFWFTRTWVRRRRPETRDRQRKVGHDGSWTRGEEEEK